MKRAELKRRAREQLGYQLFSDNWLLAIVASFIVSVIVSLAGTLTCGLIGVLVAGPLTFGLSALYLKQARDRESMDIGNLFKGFKDCLGDMLLLSLMRQIFLCLWTLLFIIPGIVKYYAYSFAYYLKADHPEYSWNQCLRESRVLAKGHKWHLFVLDLSFIGWYIVGVLCLGVGVLWVDAYHTAAKTQYYNSLVKGVQVSDEAAEPAV